MLPIAAATAATNIASNALGTLKKLTGSFGQSDAFKSRQVVRDEFYAVLRQAGDYFGTKGDAGKAAVAEMNAQYSDLSPSRNYGKIGPDATHLTALKTWVNAKVAELEGVSGSGVNLAGVGSGLTAKAFGIPLWALILAGGILAWALFGRKGA